MANITRAISVNGWANVLTLLRTSLATYDGGLVKTITISNINAAAATVHLTDVSTQPSTATDGMPIGTTAASAPGGAQIVLENIDLGSIWINTGAAQNINFLVNGNR